MDNKLDRKKSFGTVYGDPRLGYEQDNQQFKHDGTLHVEQPKEPLPKPVAAVESLPTAEQLTSTPKVLAALDALSSQIKDLKGEHAPDPVRSEQARKIWADRRAREAAQAGGTNGIPNNADAQSPAAIAP